MRQKNAAIEEARLRLHADIASDLMTTHLTQRQIAVLRGCAEDLVYRVGKTHGCRPKVNKQVVAGVYGKRKGGG